MFSFDVVSPAEGRRYIIVRQKEDYMRGTQLASRTTQTLLNTSLSFSPSSSALSFSLSINITVIVLCANEDMKHCLSSYVSHVKRQNRCIHLVLHRSSLVNENSSPPPALSWGVDETRRH